MDNSNTERLKLYRMKNRKKNEENEQSYRNPWNTTELKSRGIIRAPEKERKM
jgi:hypothetical protein